MELSSGQATLSYDITWASVFLLLFSAAEICASFMLIYRSVSRGGLASNNFRPLFWGIAIMGAAMLLDLIPGLASVLPVDPFACMINALLVYYMLYKKRVFALTQLASSASTYLISMVLTTLTLFSCYRGLDELFANHLHNLIPYKALITAVFFSIFTILVFTLLKKLANNIFIRGKQAREDSLKNFSYAINKTLDEKEIVRVFTDVIRENVDVEIGYIFVRDSDGKYRIAACTDKMRSKASALTEDSAVIRWMRSNRESISYSSFKYTANYKSMWESEKSLFVRLQVEMIVPILYDEDLVGLVLLRHPYALLLAFLIAFIDALPVFGTGTVLIPWALLSCITGRVPYGIALAALYAVIALVRSVMEPKLVAAQAGLPPLAALVAMYVGFCALGVAGMLLFPLALLFIKQLHDAGLLHLWK